jgi:pimeloyl-ACP methyl ester carboxylesterase
LLAGLIAASIAALLIVACGGGRPAPAGTAATASRTAEPGVDATPSASARQGGPVEPDLAGLFDVGGHSLYLECFGTSGPVVLFDAGSGSAGDTWKRSRKGFIGLVDNDYRRCLYDRANLGRSDRVPGHRTSATAAEELHTLLHTAGLEPPYVLVGRSFGGYNIRLFAAAFPAEVRSLILIETLTPRFHDGMRALLTPAQWAIEVEGLQATEAPLDIIGSTPLVAAAALPDVPLLVIAGTKWHSGNAPWPADWPGPQLDALWDQAQLELGASVPRGRTVVFEGGDHSLHFSQPQRLADEINAFLVEGRS